MFSFNFWTFVVLLLNVKQLSNQHLDMKTLLAVQVHPTKSRSTRVEAPGVAALHDLYPMADLYQDQRVRSTVLQPRNPLETETDS